MSSRLIAGAAALVSIAAIVAIAATTVGLPTWAVVVVGAALFGIVIANELRTRKLGTLVLETLRAKGPMTVTQVAQAIDRPHARIAIISALIRLRSNGSVTRAPIESEIEGAGPKDSHIYSAS